MEPVLHRLAKGFPVIGITGPRQAGKTTLAKHCFPDRPYVSLENPDTLEHVQQDPRGFLDQYPDGLVIDEVQRDPRLFSYLQGLVDQQQVMGQYILTGSEQFGFREKATQTLAGRIGLLQLTPYTMTELKQSAQLYPDLDQQLVAGFYPPLYSRDVSQDDWYANYVQTYVERDIQQIIQIKDLNKFRTFLRLCAGRVGQLLNLSSIGNDCGVSHNTVREWISILEASYIIFRLTPHFENFSKRLIKSEKLYFYDTGLMCWLLNIKSDEQVRVNPLAGNIFENMIVAELLKQRLIQSRSPDLYFWRDKSQLEIDVILDQGSQLMPIEIKKGKTIVSDFFKNLTRWRELARDKAAPGVLIYGGHETQSRENCRVLPWYDCDQLVGL